MRGGSKRVWFLQVNSTCSDCWSWVSLPDKHTQCFHFLTGFQIGLPAGCDSRGIAAKAWTPSHLFKAGRIVLFFAIILWPVKEKFFIFHFWTLGVRVTCSQCKVKPLNYCSFSIVSFLWKHSSAPFTYTAWQSWVWSALPVCLHMHKDDDVRQQGHLQAAGRNTRNICAVHSYWPHILYSDTLGQGGPSELKMSHRFEWGQIFNSWILRLTVFRVGGFFSFFTYTNLKRKGSSGKTSNPHIHTHIQNGLDMLLQRVYFLWTSLLKNPPCILG